ncbi:Hypothetical_protein [Hexamita inflata]|uniref:Hypothetical_protein n=1 Tax=Hexamita inflata TaxID=28002 RepID=A0AA86U492_9EUKA|nr:Hypothetical protein HINF_LOCUS25037 [Hexamita inflata]
MSSVQTTNTIKFAAAAVFKAEVENYFSAAQTIIMNTTYYDAIGRYIQAFVKNVMQIFFIISLFGLKSSFLKSKRNIRAVEANFFLKTETSMLSTINKWAIVNTIPSYTVDVILSNVYAYIIPKQTNNHIIEPRTNENTFNYWALKKQPNDVAIQRNENTTLIIKPFLVSVVSQLLTAAAIIQIIPKIAYQQKNGTIILLSCDYSFNISSKQSTDVATPQAIGK